MRQKEHGYRINWKKSILKMLSFYGLYGSFRVAGHKRVFFQLEIIINVFPRHSYLCYGFSNWQDLCMYATWSVKWDVTFLMYVLIRTP